MHLDGTLAGFLPKLAFDEARRPLVAFQEELPLREIGKLQHGPEPPSSTRKIDGKRGAQQSLAVKRGHPLAGGADQDGHVAVDGAVLVHDLVAVAGAVEGEDLRETGVDLAVESEVIERLRLHVI